MLDEQHQHFSLHMDTGPDSRRHWTQPRAVWIQIMRSKWQSCRLLAPPPPAWAGRNPDALVDLKLNLRGWPRPSWRTANSMLMRWPLESIKPAVGGVRCRRWGGFFLVGRQWEQDFPERMDPYFSNISWGCDPVNLCDESFWLVLLLWCCGNLFAPESWSHWMTFQYSTVESTWTLTRVVEDQYRSGGTIPANEGRSLSQNDNRVERKLVSWPRGKCLYWGSYHSYHLWWLRQTWWKTWKVDVIVIKFIRGKWVYLHRFKPDKPPVSNTPMFLYLKDGHFTTLDPDETHDPQCSWKILFWRR